MNVSELKAERMRNGMSQVELAKAIGCNVHSYRKKEAGFVAFSLEEICAIACVLKLTAERFNEIFFDGRLPFGK